MYTQKEQLSTCNELHMILYIFALSTGGELEENLKYALVNNRNINL